jgi:hypothetical protein
LPLLNFLKVVAELHLGRNRVLPLENGKQEHFVGFGELNFEFVVPCQEYLESNLLEIAVLTLGET